ncbi:MAG: BspA family leucine-rich repeat surface protein, partial [Clostridia bacterium]|nr:BspA family leucine-rich repeat surface protein [Clostridia bacterium]
NFKGEEKELLKNGRGAEIFSGSNFGAQNFNNCGQKVDRGYCNAKGITLIALIITIVIMLILAGITINLTLGENGIFQRAKLAKGDYELASVKEQLEMDLVASELGDGLDVTMEQYLDKIKGVEVQRRLIEGSGTNNEKTIDAVVIIDNKIYNIYEENNKIKVVEEKGNVMMTEGTWSNYEDGKWLNLKDGDHEILKTEINTIEFKNHKNIPEDCDGSCDITAIGHEPESVMAWWTGNQTDGYNICIGAEGGVIAPRNCDYLFADCTSLTSVSFGENFDTSNTTSMTWMFRISNGDTSSLTSIDVEHWDTRNVTSMSCAFLNLTRLDSLDVSNFNTENVKSFAHMFRGLFLYSGVENEKSLDISNFDTSKAVDMEWMFNNINVSRLDISNFDTRNVTNMYNMFGSDKIITIILGDKFVTNNVENFGGMFSACSNLQTLRLGNFGVNIKDGANTGDMLRIFNTNCQIYI